MRFKGKIVYLRVGILAKACLWAPIAAITNSPNNPHYYGVNTHTHKWVHTAKTPSSCTSTAGRPPCPQNAINRIRAKIPTTQPKDLNMYTNTDRPFELQASIQEAILRQGF